MDGILVGRNEDATFWAERWASRGGRLAVLAAYYSLDDLLVLLIESGLTVYFDSSIGEDLREFISQRLAAAA